MLHYSRSDVCRNNNVLKTIHTKFYFLKCYLYRRLSPQKYADDWCRDMWQVSEHSERVQSTGVESEESAAECARGSVGEPGRKWRGGGAAARTKTLRGASAGWQQQHPTRQRGGQLCASAVQESTRRSCSLASLPFRLL